MSGERLALGGVRVVEFACGIAGPYATRLLADQGADVVKVEPTGGDPYRGEPGFQALNRNKRSVVTPQPEVLLGELAADADVVVTDRPDLTSAVRERSTRAVVVSMPPLPAGIDVVGDAASATSGAPAEMKQTQHTSPAAVAAITGIAWTQLSYAEAPVHVVLPVASYGAAMLGAVVAAAGLYAREACGAAGTYEVSEVAGAGAMQVGLCTTPDTDPFADGSSPLGSAGRAPAYRLLRAADGEWLFVACGTTSFYESLLDAIKRTDLAAHPKLPDPPWGLIDPDAVAFLTPILEDTFATRTRAEWLATLAAHDVPCAPIQTRQEFLTSSLAHANDVDVTLEHPELGEVVVTAQPFALDGYDVAAPVRAPLLGEHTDEVLAELTVSVAPAAPSSQTSTDKTPSSDTPGTDTSCSETTPDASAPTPEAPLAGVSAIDLSSFIAGPVITRHLAMLGADVIKVEPPTGDPFRSLGALFNGWNQNKRGVSLDLKTDADRAVLQRLLADVDVVVENFRPAVAARLGCAQDQLRAANPHLIVARSNGYGDDETMAAAPAFDPLLQALGGAMAAQGGDADPVFLTVPIHDTVTPLLGALGAVVALYARARGGGAATVRTSLTQSTTAAQAAEMVRYAGRPPAEVGGFDHSGPGEHARFEQSESAHPIDDSLVRRRPGEHARFEQSESEEATPGEWHWVERDGTHERRWPVTKHFTSSPAATGADMVLTQLTEWGAVTCPGQLVRGVEVALAPAPRFDEHGAAIRSALVVT